MEEQKYLLILFFTEGKMKSKTESWIGAEYAILYLLNWFVVKRAKVKGEESRRPRGAQSTAATGGLLTVVLSERGLQHRSRICWRLL